MTRDGLPETDITDETFQSVKNELLSLDALPGVENPESDYTRHLRLTRRVPGIIAFDELLERVEVKIDTPGDPDEYDYMQTHIAHFGVVDEMAHLLTETTFSMTRKDGEVKYAHASTR